MSPSEKPTTILIADLRVPVALARGHYEKVSTPKLVSHLWDIVHEITRRGVDPFEKGNTNEPD